MILLKFAVRDAVSTPDSVTRYWLKYREHYAEIMKLSLPIMVAQLGTIVTGYADTIMVGRYSTQSLAAASLVTNIFNLVILLSLGFSYGITPLVGALHARGDTRGCGRLLREAMVANVLWGALLMAVMTALYFFLDSMGQPPEIMPLVKSYYLMVLASMAPVVVTHVMRQFCDAVGHTQLGMWVFTFGNVLNIVGNYALIYGHWGCPELGLAGAGWSTLAARVAMCVAFLVCVAAGGRYHDIVEGCLCHRVKLPAVARMATTSTPVALQMGTETCVFTFAAIVAGWLGATALAAYQILVMLGSLGFMVYYAFGAGMAIKVAHCCGLADVQGVRASVHAGFAVTLAFALLACAIFVLAGRWIVAAFSTDYAVTALSVSLLVPLSLYQLGDATQVTFANALRGMGLVLPMMKRAILAYVFVGLPLIYALSVYTGWGLHGVYIAFFVSLLTAGLLFSHKFYKTLGRVS